MFAQLLNTQPLTVFFSLDFSIMDIAFAIDIPEIPADWTKEKTFIKKLITDYLKVGATEVHVAVLTYGIRSATIVFNLTRYSDESEIKYAIDQIPYVASGNADVTYALNTLSQTIFRVHKGLRLSLFLGLNGTIIRVNYIPRDVRGIEFFS